jgi:hypothetical protein
MSKHVIGAGSLTFRRNGDMWECHTISPDGDKSRLIGAIHMALVATDDPLIRDQFVELMKRGFLFAMQKAAGLEDLRAEFSEERPVN